MNLYLLRLSSVGRLFVCVWLRLFLQLVFLGSQSHLLAAFWFWMQQQVANVAEIVTRKLMRVQNVSEFYHRLYKSDEIRFYGVWFHRVLRLIRNSQSTTFISPTHNNSWRLCKRSVSIIDTRTRSHRNHNFACFRFERH